MSTAAPLTGDIFTGDICSPLRRRLERYYRMPARDGRRLDGVQHRGARIDAEEDILSRGARNESFIVIEDGWSYRYRVTRKDKRQILNFLVPGDIVNPDSVAVSRTDHGIRSLTSLTYRVVERDHMGSLLRDCPSIVAALWWSNAQEKGMLQAQIVRLGRQSAIQRIGNLLLELHRRLSLVQELDHETMSFVLPLTQKDLADALGLSSVHVSRVLSELRRRRLLRRNANSVEILAPHELAEQCEFDVEHLHLDSSVSDSFWD
jgi:CRP-like cAMP-binding protein